MAQWSKIEWTDATWNPVTGCAKISPGCKHCYAERMARRLQSMGQERYRNGFSVTLHRDLISQPLKWGAPRQIFVNSMGDLFHKAVPLSFISDVFATINAAHWHNFQVLTKRAERLEQLTPKLNWPDNLWIGVSVESKSELWRIRSLSNIPALIKFVSLEPLIGPIRRLPLKGISWVIVGGESGPGARLMRPEWVRTIRDQCKSHSVPFFFKQWGGFVKSHNGRELDGEIWSQLPMATSNILQRMALTRRR